MIEFDPKNPFPLLDLNSFSYNEAQEHAALVDQWLGFEIESTEQKIRNRGKESETPQAHQNWEHLSAQAMQTPYVELRHILDLLNLQPESHIVDLGSAYGRMGFIIHAHHSNVRFTGHELEADRVQESQRLMPHEEHPLIRFIQADLSDSAFELVEANVYFIFDYGNEASVRKTLFDLQKMACTRSFQVVARGRLSRFLIHKEHPWLAEVHTPRHFPHFSIYQS